MEHILAHALYEIYSKKSYRGLAVANRLNYFSLFLALNYLAYIRPSHPQICNKFWVQSRHQFIYSYRV